MLPGYRPMLAVPWATPFSDDAWSFEPKWDGIRALLARDRLGVRVSGRRGGDLTDRYPELARLPTDETLVLDGEIIAPGEDGRPSFELLQGRMHLTGDAAARAVQSVPIAYVAFDLLHYGEPLLSLPLRRRRERLESLGLPAPVVVSEAVAGDGASLWRAVRQRDLEGMVAKRLESPYRPGVRSPDWRKIANVATARAVIGGFTRGAGGRAGTFGSLLLGMAEGGALRFVGAVGTGFSDRSLHAIRATLDHLTRPDPPFHRTEGLPAEAVWVEPALVASIAFREWTSAGRLRHPRFRGFTDDVPEDVSWEQEGPAGVPEGDRLGRITESVRTRHRRAAASPAGSPESGDGPTED